jgi:16S rRNA (cytosine1402-N4)-methyltransferase
MSAHLPVMCREVVDLLQPQRGGTFVDCTVGLGGHARALLDAGATRLVGIDRDETALALARETLAPYAGRAELVHADYRDLDAILDVRGLSRVEGILADLGVSSMQLDEPGRGFSFRRDEPLDMRMDRTRGESAAEWIRTAGEEELANVIYEFGEERFSRRIARALVEARDRDPIETTGQLAALVRRAIPSRGWQRIDPATRTFQAIRIRVNHELDRLDRFIDAAVARLAAGARCVVISFHSLEDRIVKRAFRALAQGGRGVLGLLTKHPIVASDEELAVNVRARSAKLRAIERLA